MHKRTVAKRSQGYATSRETIQPKRETRSPRLGFRLVHVVVNHLHLREPLPNKALQSAQEVLRAVVQAGGLAARVIEVDPLHLILLLEFSSAEDADRIAKEVGGPWMRANVVPLLVGDTERSVGKVVASAQAGHP